VMDLGSITLKISMHSTKRMVLWSI
jgi:hypothetical protein